MPNEGILAAQRMMSAILPSLQIETYGASPKKLARAPQRTATPSWRKNKEAHRRAVIICHQLRQKKPDDVQKILNDDEIKAKKDPIMNKTMRKIKRNVIRIITDSALIENNRLGKCRNTEKEKDIDEKRKNSEKYSSYHHTMPQRRYPPNCNKYKQLFFSLFEINLE